MEFDVTRALNEARAEILGWAEGLIRALPNLAGALLVLLAFWGLARIARYWVGRGLDRVTSHPQINQVVATFAYLGVLLTGLFIALGILELDKTVTSLLAGAGIIGLALSFAFQDTAENFIAGILLAVRRQFTDGDIVETNDFMGIIERVNMRATILRTFQGQRVVVPNSEVYKNPLVNYTTLGARRIDLSVGVSYGDDLEQARRVAVAAIQSMEQRDPTLPVELFYEEFGDSSINFVVQFWIRFGAQREYLDARSEAIIRIKKAFDAQGITIPFPIRTVDFSEVGGVLLSEAMPTPPEP